MIIFQNEEDEIGAFRLEDYSQYIQDFPNNTVLGEISTVQEVRKSAEDIWIEIYGDRVTKNKPYNVFYDEENEVWLVTGTSPKSTFGGVPYILIEKADGKVLAVWHDK